MHASSRWKLVACNLLGLSSFARSQHPIARRKNKQVCCVLIRGRGKEGVVEGKDERARARRERSTRTGSEGVERGSRREGRPEDAKDERVVSSSYEATVSSSCTHEKGYTRATFASTRFETMLAYVASFVDTTRVSVATVFVVTERCTLVGSVWSGRRRVATMFIRVLLCDF